MARPKKAETPEAAELKQATVAAPEEKPAKTAAKKPAAKAEKVEKAPEKTTAKKTAAKKPAVKKSAAKVQEEIVIQFQGKELQAADLVTRAKDAWLADGGDLQALKSIAVYFKPEESMVYYVINNTISGSYTF